MRFCIAGAAGAFGLKHLDALAAIEGANVVSIVDTKEAVLAELATTHQIPHYTTRLEEALSRDDIDAVILATPTQMHAEQAIQCMEAGKHVLIEIPMSDSLANAHRIIETQKRTGKIAMVGHVRRFNPSHQWIRNRILAGELKLLQMDVQTYFLRRSNLNAKGEPRCWTDHLLWHHACHTVDLFQYQTGEVASQVYGLQGPIHPELGIAMDMSIGMQVRQGAICTLSLSFNNDGPFGAFFRYICDNGTYIARYDDLYDGNNNPIDLNGVATSNNGVELEDREFIAAIRENREPNASVQQCFAAMETLDRIEQCLSASTSNR